MFQILGFTSMSALSPSFRSLSVAALLAAGGLFSVCPSSALAGKDDNDGDRTLFGNDSRQNIVSELRDLDTSDVLPDVDINVNIQAGGDDGLGIGVNLTTNTGTDANQNTVERAAPNSTPARLAVYSEAYVEGTRIIREQNDAANELIRLQNLTQSQIAAQFPRGGYEAALRAASARYVELTEDARAAQIDIQAALMALTGGREISQEDLHELHQMLGI